MSKILTKEQEQLFILWAGIRLNVKCSTEEELREKVGNKKIDELKANYMAHIIK